MGKAQLNIVAPASTTHRNLQLSTAHASAYAIATFWCLHQHYALHLLTGLWIMMHMPTCMDNMQQRFSNSVWVSTVIPSQASAQMQWALQSLLASVLIGALQKSELKSTLTRTRTLTYLCPLETLSLSWMKNTVLPGILQNHAEIRHFNRIPKNKQYIHTYNTYKLHTFVKHQKSF